MRTSIRTFATATIAALALLLAACSDPQALPADLNGAPEQNHDLGTIRAVHASPDAPAVDVVVVDGNGDVAARLFENLAYGNASADRIEVPAGDYTVGVTTVGGDTVLYSQNVTLGGEDYTVVATGYVSNLLDDDPGNDGDIEPFRFEAYATDLTPVRPGKVRVQAIHGAPAEAAALVDLYVSRPGKKLEQVAPVEDFAFTDDLTTELRPGNQRVRIAVADTDLVAIDSGRVRLPNRGILTLIAIGIPQDGTLDDFGLIVIAE